MTMDPEAVEVFKFVMNILPWAALIVAISVGGWMFSTWIRIKNGYPLETSWGVPVHPKTDRETTERIRLLTTENAQLRAELGSIKDRSRSRCRASGSRSGTRRRPGDRADRT